MNILSNHVEDKTSTTRTVVEREHDEDLLGFHTDGFYKIQGCIFSGHDIGCMEQVAWDAAAQEWKVVR